MKHSPNSDYKDSDNGYLLINYFGDGKIIDLPITKNSMKAETIRLHKKAEKIQEKLREFNFHHFEHYWYNDGVASGAWEDLSVACDEPDDAALLCSWQFGFRSSWSTNRRLHIEAIMPVHEDYFTFDLKYYPDIKLHRRKGSFGPTPVLTVQGILEEDLPNLQKYIDYLVK
jgi:hypothetical protein